MVKRQKEKQYLSSREQKAQSKSRSSATNQDNRGDLQKSLPFKYCALTLVPFESPVCTIYEFKGSDTQKAAKYGIVFDSASLTDFVWKHKKDPVTGNPLVSSKIIKLQMDQDSESGEWQCPVLTKAFSDRTKIVAVLTPDKTEANVYSYEAYHELNVKPKSYLDLTTGFKFHPKKDVILINDPENQLFQKTVREVSNFWHITNARSGGLAKLNNSNNDNIRKSVTATRVMEQIQKKNREKELEAERAKKAKAAAAASAKSDDGSPTFEVAGSNLPFVVPTEDVTGVKYTSGAAAWGLTSTSSGTTSSNESRAATPEEILDSRFRLMKSWKGKKGYVNLLVEIRRGPTKTPLALPLLLELHCDICPRTCYNFLGLCAQKKYDGTVFHRLIFDFMIQGGGEKLKQRPTKNSNKTSTTAKSSNDASLWGPDGFADEFDDRLKHTDGGGVLAMANAGPNTNKQQFYITLSKACPHLDRKHSVFGSVAKGMEAFRKALTEDVSTDSKDRPVLKSLDTTNGETTITNAVVVIMATEVLEDPSKEAREMEDRRLTELHELREAQQQKRKRLFNGSKSADRQSKQQKKEPMSEIGRYLSKKAFPNQSDDSAVTTEKSVFGAGKSKSDIGLPDIAPPVKPKKAKKAEFGDFSSW